MDEPVVSAVLARKRPRGKPIAWKKLPRARPDWDYPEDIRKRRVWFREEIKDRRRRATNCKWYANVTKDDPPETLSHREWVRLRRENIELALEARRQLRATNFR
jgi:hypothetical protein